MGVGSPCAACEPNLRDAPSRNLAPGVLVLAAYLHEGPARALVHRLKYRADPGPASLLGVAMAAKLPRWAAALVPVPRARLRLWRYGIDPSLELAKAVSKVTSLPVVPALVPPWWWPPHAAGSRTERRGPRFGALRLPPTDAVLIDDVVTSGATLAAANQALGDHVGAALVATAA